MLERVPTGSTMALEGTEQRDMGGDSVSDLWGPIGLLDRVQSREASWLLVKQYLPGRYRAGGLRPTHHWLRPQCPEVK